MTPLNLPVIVAVMVAETAVVVIVKIAAVEPAGTETDAGTMALPLFELRVTETPPAGAAPLSVTVPAAEAPPVTTIGEVVKLDSEGGLTVKVDETDALAAVAVMIGIVADTTGLVVIAKVTVVEPAATVTVDGTAAEGSELERLTISPPAAAAPAMVTVAVELTPPTTAAGLRARPVTGTERP